MQIIDKYHTENDNIYVSVSFTNKSRIEEQILEYNVTKTAPILKNGNEYYVSVVRFDLCLTSIPITIFPVQPGQSDPNLSTLQVGIKNGATTSYQFLEYVAQNHTLPVPIQSNPNQQIITQYYYVYSYEQMITMINKALQLAYTGALLTGTAPYLVYDSVTSLISLIVGAEFNTLNGPQVLINYPMLQYLNAFDFDGLGVNTFGQTIYQFVINGLVNESYAYVPFGQNPPVLTSPPAAPAAPLFYKITQEYVYLGAWNPIRKILIVSNTLPIVSEVVPANNVSLSQVQNNDGVYSSMPILSEFVPIIEEGSGNGRTTAYFNTDGNYGLRLVDILTNGPIYKLDIKVYWQDIANNINALYIPTFQQSNIKLGFIRKSLYKHF
jgi:hypothetical protein